MESSKYKFKTIEEVLNISTRVDKRILKLYFNKANLFQESREQYKNESPLWIFSAISHIEQEFHVWLVQNLKLNRKDLLLVYKDICLSIYEDSDIFYGCDETEKEHWHKKIAEVIEHTNCYVEALRIIETGKQEEFVDNIIKKVKTSSYLYEPEKKIRILMSVFVLAKFSMREQIEPIFDAIIEKHGDTHFKANYSEAMNSFLDVFIECERIEIDKITKISNKYTKERVKMLIKAIVILVLLNKDNKRDTSLLRSMLYRYASLISNKGKDNLFEKAYTHLLKKNSNPLEFNWRDLEDNAIITEKKTDRIALLCSKLANTPLLQFAPKKYKIHFPKGIVYLDSDINIYQNPKGESKNKAFNDDILKWHKIKIWLKERLKEKVRQGETNITNLQNMWKEVEKSFFSTPLSVKKPSKNEFILVEGDQVDIRVTQKSSSNPYHFECVVEQTSYVGKGFISINQIVHYPVQTDIDSFQSENGYPMRIKAKVLNISPDRIIEFSLLDNIGIYIYDSVKIGDTTECIISKIDEKNYTCVSEYGYALQFYKNETEEELRKGEIVEVEICNRWRNGNVRGRFVRIVENADPISLKNAFTYLMESYTEGKIYKREDEKEVTEEGELSLNDFFEFIHIVDYKAMAESEHCEIYNYTALCRLLSLMIEDSVLADYYDMRMSLIKKLYELGLNGSIDIDELNRQMSEASDILFKFPELNDMVTQFFIIGLLGKPWEEGKLWMLAREHDNETIQRLARLVLSYNLLDDLNVDEQREQIRNRISKLLNIEVKIPEATYIGVEDEYTEFKASLVYPAGNKMIHDIEKQMNEILQVICGFLNHKGGNLYIGVNDSGYVSGLECDFLFFSKGNSNYDLPKAKDEMLNRFWQGANRLGSLATEKISPKYDTDNKYLKIEIEPSPKLVKFDEKGYIRRGSSTFPINPKEWKELEESRLRKYAQP